MATNEELNKSYASRLLSLDVFRGITIAAMILVNNPGTWSDIYSPLKHAEWHGWTPTDFVFPFFLFIVGAAIPLAFARRAEDGGNQKRDLYLKIIRRSCIIFALGLFLEAFPGFDLVNLRIPGVLQRIALCYLITSIIYLKTTWRTQLGIGIALLLIYWGLMTLAPVPGFGPSDINSKEWNLAAYIDRAVFGLSHIWQQAKVYDPEGLLSTIPAISTTIAGVLTGTWIRSDREQIEKAAGIFFAGAVCVSIGWSWNFFFPINKALWTGSYVVFTAGMALQLLGICYWLVDIKGYKRWTKPFVIFGVNALALYVLSGMLSETLGFVNITGANGDTESLQTWIFEHLFLSWASPINASLAYALSYVLLWLFFMWLLYRKRIFIKV